jgi:hypothetical protein
MAKKTEERLDQLKQLRKAPTSDPGSTLRKALTDRSNLIVAEAAKIAGELRCVELIVDLVAALERLFEDPAKTDPKCWGKSAIIRALTLLDYSESPPFLRAASHIQMEPVWGGQQDSAVHLRAAAVLALVQCVDIRRAEILRHLVDALAEASDTVRIEAVRALEQMNGEESSLLLRLKAHSGDKRSAVVGQVFDSLLALEGSAAVPFVARFMDAEDSEVADEAALSLGASRLSSGVEVLIRAWKDGRGRELGPVVLRALSSSRDEGALAFLLDLVQTGIRRDADAAVEALGLHRDSPEIQARIEKAQEARKNSDR